MQEFSPALVGAIVGGVSLLLSAAGSALAIAWKTRGAIAEINARISERTSEIKDQFDKDNVQFMRSFGDSLAAVREKIRDTELWNRDNFVRRSDFSAVIDSINQSIQTLQARMDAGLSKIEAKIDKLQDR